MDLSGRSSTSASTRAGEVVESSKESEKSDNDRRIAGPFDCYMMNLGIILAGVVVGWNTSLGMGAGEYLISLGLCSIAYLCLALCISEMASAVSFAGGSYGYGRCTLSPFIGYMIGIFDLLQTVLCAAQFVDSISQAFNVAVGGSDNYRPLWWVLIYSVVILVAIPGGRFFWNSVIAVTVLTLVFMLIYILGLIPDMNFNHWALVEVPAFAGSDYTFFCSFAVPTVCFIGTDMLTVFGDEIKDSQRNIPIGMIGAIVTTILFAFACTLTALSTKPGLSEEMMSSDILFPLHFGFEELLHTSNAASHALMGITLFSSAVGFIFAAGRQMSAMARSGLLPPQLDQSCFESKTPALAMVVAAIIGICALLPVWGTKKHAGHLYEVTIVGASFVYLGLFWCFIVFKTRFAAMDRGFVSPLGLVGAAYGMIYFSICIISIFFVKLDFTCLITMIPYTILAIIYYFTVAEARQFFSKEEQSKFMKAYILNANKRKKKGPQISDRKRKMHEMYNEWGLAAVFGEWDLYKKSNSTSINGNSNHRSANSSAAGSRENSSRSRLSNSTHGLSNTDVVVGAKVKSVPGGGKIVPVVKRAPSPQKNAPATDDTTNDEFFPGGLMNDLETNIPRIETPSQRIETHVDDSVIAWSGKILDIRQSRQFFEMMNKEGTDMKDFVKELPDQFVVVPTTPTAARDIVSHSGRSVLTEVTDATQGTSNTKHANHRNHNI